MGKDKHNLFDIPAIGIGSFVQHEPNENCVNEENVEENVVVERTPGPRRGF